MESIKFFLFKNWHLMRWLRLLVGIIIAIQAFLMRDGVLAGLSFFLFFQAFTNTGCCGTSGCALPTDKK